MSISFPQISHKYLPPSWPAAPILSHSNTNINTHPSTSLSRISPPSPPRESHPISLKFLSWQAHGRLFFTHWPPPRVLEAFSYPLGVASSIDEVRKKKKKVLSIPSIKIFGFCYLMMFMVYTWWVWLMIEY